MNLLQLCLRIPFPPRDGGNIAMYNLAASLADAGCNVQMLAFNTKKHFVDENSLDKNFKKKFQLQTVFLDASIKPLDAFLNLFSDESYNIKRFISTDFEQALIGILKEKSFDVVILESLFMAPYIAVIRKHSNAKVVLRAHNVEHIIWNRLFQSEKNLLKRWYLKLLAKRLEKFEKKICRSFDAILALTPDDEKVFKDFCGNVPVFIAPIGLNVSEYKLASKHLKSDESKVELFHLGSMDWMPNIEAVDWFLKNVWNDLLKELPSVMLHLAGKGMSQAIFSKASSNLKVYGKIDDAKEFIADKNVMIVPLLSGSGMRVKIIEGMAAGKCIISTTIGCEGIKYTNGKNILMADTPQQFVEQIVFLSKHPEKIIEIGNEAHLLAEKEYDNKVIAEKVIGILKGL